MTNERADSSPPERYSARANGDAAHAVLPASAAKQVVSLHYNPVCLDSVQELDKLDQAPWEKLRVRVLSAHQMGGCAMGNDPPRSVVDSSLRYHALDNLYVVDGSVFPTSLGVNPQMTIMAMALRAAEIIDSRLG